MSFFTLEGAVFLDIPKTVIQLNAPLHFTSLKKKKLSQLDVWFSSYVHVSDIICKTPSSGQNGILFFNIFLKVCVYLGKETSFLKLRFCCSATRGSNLLFILKLHIDYSCIHHLS